MECTKCGGLIEGGRKGHNAITVDVGLNPLRWEQRGAKGQDVRHAECVDDPTRIPNDQFKKWAVLTIRATQQAASAQVQNHNDLVDALEQLHPGTRAAYEQVLLRGTDAVDAIRFNDARR